MIWLSIRDNWWNLRSIRSIQFIQNILQVVYFRAVLDDQPPFALLLVSKLRIGLLYLVPQHPYSINSFKILLKLIFSKLFFTNWTKGAFDDHVDNHAILESKTCLNDRI